MSTESLGLLAGVLTTTAWLPQIARTWRRGGADDLSWPYLLVLGSGIALWVAYGALSRDVPLLAANGITMFLVGVLLVLKGRPRRTADRSTIAGSRPPRSKR